MSFLTRITPATRTTLSSSSPLFLRTAVAAKPAPFSTTSVQQKGPIQVAKEGLKKADKKVSDVAVKGIEKGEHASEKFKHTVGKSKQAEEKARKAAKEEFNGDTKGFEG